MSLVPGGYYKSQLMQSAAGATGNGTPIECIDSSSGAFTMLGMQITGISGDTITFEATIDGTNWVAIRVENVADQAQATTATADGLYRVVCATWLKVRARVSTYDAGTIYVTGSLVA